MLLDLSYLLCVILQKQLQGLKDRSRDQNVRLQNDWMYLNKKYVYYAASSRNTQMIGLWPGDKV